MGDWRHSWAEWLKEGHYLSYLRDGTRYYESILFRDFAHWEYNWPERITTLTESGPYIPDDLEITRGYDPKTNHNQIWQFLIGIETQAYIYIELPTELHRHGIPKQPKPGTSIREVSHYEEYMSPFVEPSFITEHFLMRPDCLQIAFSAYNPTSITIRPRLNIVMAKLVTERVGTEEEGELSTVDFGKGFEKKTARVQSRWSKTLELLYKGQIPCRPLTLYPIRAPAEAPGGE